MAVIVIEEWMIRNLQLKGDKLLAYALIHNCTQKGYGCWYGGYDKLAERVGSSQRGIVKCVKSLIEENLITKGDAEIDGKQRQVLRSNPVYSEQNSENNVQRTEFREQCSENNVQRKTTPKVQKRSEQNSDNKNIIKNNKKTYSDEVEKLYALYPTKCPLRNTPTDKGSKDKDKLAKLLKTYSYEQLESAIKQYINERYGKSYIKGFTAFLNKLPDYIDNAESPSIPLVSVADDDGLFDGVFYSIDELKSHYGTHWYGVFAKIQENKPLCQAMYNDGGLVRHNNAFMSKMDYSAQGR